jgi:magnesium chelatase family protein
LWMSKLISDRDFPSFTLSACPMLPSRNQESVRSAIRNSGAEFPMRRITVSLAPADLKNSGPACDLPIAMGLLMSSG